MAVYAGFTPAETRAALKRRTEPSYQGTFTGARRHVLHTFATSQSALMRRRAARFMRGSACPLCDGKRLKREALAVKFAGLDIGAMAQLSFDRLAEVLAPAASGAFGGGGGSGGEQPKRAAMSEGTRIAARRIATDLLARLAALRRLGLGYLSLERATPTLSPGELQRLRLATQIRSNLFGVVYVLDEPSAGLHPADSDALMEALDELKRAGNSIFVVEHDLDVMRRADWLVDVGPDAGELGGRVLYSGPPAGLRAIAASHTAAYLFAGKRAARREPRAPRDWLVLQGVTLNNLHAVDARFALQAMTAVTGVSGSGKSSLVTEALVDLVLEALGKEPAVVEPDADAPEGDTPLRASGRIASSMDGIKRLVQVDQKAIGRTPRSNLATYTGLFDHVRKLFAQTPSARARRFDAGRFSFNVAKGRCDTCEGEGFVSVELLFMPSVYAPCPACHGARLNEATLKVRWHDKHIAEVLGMTVDQALQFFADEPAIETPLRLLRDIGLGYLRLGQPATELSGGEAQRIKLATELQRAQRGDALYVLDEPTTGLHAADVDRLMAQLQRLVAAGNTVIVVEHDLRVIEACDWVIDMGPGGGDAGGQVVAMGTPAEVAGNARSRTGAYLQRAHERNIA